MNALTQTIPVNLGDRSYDIVVGVGLLPSLGERLKNATKCRRAMLVTDSKVGPLYADAAIQSLANEGIEADCATVPAGDASKSLSQATVLYERLAARAHERGEPIVSLGGGMVGDLAGFVASTWMRGVPFIQCPTTLEADIDAAIGGKTAVNQAAGKNLIGTFHQPEFVLIDINCLRTLPDREFIAGMAESVKHAILSGKDAFDWHVERLDQIRQGDSETLVELVHQNCAYKAAVVSADERERDHQGVGRAALNFGHTIGHAIERAANYQLRHGECVALGMVAELDLARAMGRGSNEVGEATSNLLSAIGLDTNVGTKINPAELAALMRNDKKSHNGELRFAIPTDWGRCEWFISPSERDLIAAIERISQPS